MAKKEDVNKELFVIIVISVVAVFGLFAASSGGSGMAASQGVSPNVNCDEESVCIEWEWESSKIPVCEEFEVIEYKVCTKYSEETGELECIEWTIMPESQCKEWNTESDWQRKCVNRQTFKNCELEE